MTDPWTDALAVRDLLDRYAVALDTRDWGTVGECFTADCEADYGHPGTWRSRAELVEALDVMHRGVGPSLHRMTNHQIDVDGDTATAVSYLDAVLKVEHRGFDLLHVIALYHDTLVRDGGRWRIATRRVEPFLWRREHATS